MPRARAFMMQRGEGGSDGALRERIVAAARCRKTSDEVFLNYAAAWVGGEIGAYQDPYTLQPGTVEDFVLHCNVASSIAACLPPDRRGGEYPEALANAWLASAMRHFSCGDIRMAESMINLFVGRCNESI
jgi:hypothetical protein